VRQGVFFSQAAVVTFGGAYSVLVWVAQEAVGTFGWLTPGEMLDALALAETTPGPLIMVVQFVAFLGAHRDPGPLDPWAAGILGSVVTTWVTFVPCFVWIFAGAPWVERLRGVRSLSAALTAITAAVLGVIANLAAFLALHVLFGRVEETTFAAGRVLVPDLGTFAPASAVLAVAAFVALVRFRAALGWVLAGSAAAGCLLSAVPGLT
jgi:chromate transporter